MALAVLCPKPLRDRFRADWQNKVLSDYEVALEFRIPEAAVRTVMGDYFDTALQNLLAV